MPPPPSRRVKKLIFQHQVFMLHGGGCSNATIAARPEIEKGNLPWVVFASVADEVTLPTASLHLLHRARGLASRAPPRSSSRWSRGARKSR